MNGISKIEFFPSNILGYLFPVSLFLITHISSDTLNNIPILGDPANFV